MSVAGASPAAGGLGLEPPRARGDGCVPVTPRGHPARGEENTGEEHPYSLDDDGLRAGDSLRFVVRVVDQDDGRRRDLVREALELR